MKPIRYRPNPTYEPEIRAQPLHQRGMRKITKEIAAVVRAMAPHRTGYYERRVKAKGLDIRTLDPMWHVVEFGSANNPPYAPLRRGLWAAGARLVMAPKPPPMHGPRRQRRRKRK